MSDCKKYMFSGGVSFSLMPSYGANQGIDQEPLPLELAP